MVKQKKPLDTFFKSTQSSGVKSKGLLTDYINQFNDLVKMFQGLLNKKFIMDGLNDC